MSQNAQALLESLAVAPGLTLLAVAADAATGAVPPPETLAAMCNLVADGALGEIDARQAWPLLERGLMGNHPSRWLAVLSACGAMDRLLPEFAALAGCHQIGADGEAVDIAAHQGRVLDLAAACHAPLRVRLAALLGNLGKADSPPQHLPAHYRHIDRCLPRIGNIARRFGLSSELEAFARLAAAELERVHRATRMRADALTALLERVDALAEGARFDDLLTLCACDWAAYPGQAAGGYPKAALLRQALAACRQADDEAAAAGEPPDHEHRTMAVATALRSCRDDS